MRDIYVPNKSEDVDRQLVRRMLRKLGDTVKDYSEQDIYNAVLMMKKKYNIKLK